MSAKRTVFTQIAAVEPAEAQENADYPSITVIRAGEADTLWSLGKRYHSTGAMIAELNSLADGDKLTGRVLLIPCARLKG